MSASTGRLASEARARPKPRRWLRWSAAALLLVSSGVAVWRFSQRPPAPVDPALVTTVEREPLLVEVVDVGRIQAFEQVEIASRIPGRVARVRVDEGDRVEAGQTLLELDRREALRGLRRARAELARARARRDYAAREQERKLTGARLGVVSLVDAQASEQERKVADLDMKLLGVALAEANDQLHDTRLVSPISGVVTRRAIEPGEMVKPGVESSFESVALLTIADLSRLIVKIDMNQIDVAKLRVGQKVRVVLDPLPGESFRARVTRIAAAAVRVPGKDVDSFPVEAELDAADPRIKPGMTADVRILVSERSATLSLPLESVRRKAGAAYVTRLVDGEHGQTRQVVPVKLGVESESRVEILSGVQAGEHVLIDPESAASNETKI